MLETAINETKEKAFVGQSKKLTRSRSRNTNAIAKLFALHAHTKTMKETKCCPIFSY